MPATSAIPEEEIVDLSGAIVEFLRKRENCVASLTDINKDRDLRWAMQQQRRPMMSIKKTWLEEREEVFSLLRTAEGDLYVALVEAIEEMNRKRKEAEATKTSTAPKSKASAKPEERAQGPAYRMVIQKTRGDEAPPLVYHYSAAARKEDDKARGSGVAAWRERFLEVIGQSPQKLCSVDHLLTAVPQFGVAMGSKGLHEQKALLLLFLEASKDVFCVEKRGFGSSKEHMVWAKS